MSERQLKPNPAEPVDGSIAGVAPRQHLEVGLPNHGHPSLSSFAPNACVGDQAYADGAGHCVNGPRSEMLSRWMGPAPKHMGHIIRQASDVMFTVGAAATGVGLGWTALRFMGLGARAAGVGLVGRGLSSAKSHGDPRQPYQELEFRQRWTERLDDRSRLERQDAHEEKLVAAIAKERETGRATTSFETLAAELPTSIKRQVENPHTGNPEELFIWWKYDRRGVHVGLIGPKGPVSDRFEYGQPLDREISLVMRYYQRYPSTGILDARRVEHHLRDVHQHETAGRTPPDTYQQEVQKIFGSGRVATSFRDVQGERVTFWSRWDGETVTLQIIGRNGIVEDVFPRASILEDCEGVLLQRYLNLTPVAR